MTHFGIVLILAAFYVASSRNPSAFFPFFRALSRLTLIVVGLAVAAVALIGVTLAIDGRGHYGDTIALGLLPPVVQVDARPASPAQLQSGTPYKLFMERPRPSG